MEVTNRFTNYSTPPCEVITYIKGKFVEEGSKKNVSQAIIVRMKTEDAEKFIAPFHAAMEGVKQNYIDDAVTPKQKKKAEEIKLSEKLREPREVEDGYLEDTGYVHIAFNQSANKAVPVKNVKGDIVNANAEEFRFTGVREYTNREKVDGEWTDCEWKEVDEEYAHGGDTVMLGFTARVPDELFNDKVACPFYLKEVILVKRADVAQSSGSGEGGSTGGGFNYADVSDIADEDVEVSEEAIEDVLDDDLPDELKGEAPKKKAANQF